MLIIGADAKRQLSPDAHQYTQQTLSSATPCSRCF